MNKLRYACIASLLIQAVSADEPTPPATKEPTPPIVAPANQLPRPKVGEEFKPKMEKRTIGVNSLTDIRVDLRGIITFRQASTGEKYVWSCGTQDDRPIIYTAILSELRRADSIEVEVQVNGGGNEFNIHKMTLVYKSLK